MGPDGTVCVEVFRPGPQPSGPSLPDPLLCTEEALQAELELEEQIILMLSQGSNRQEVAGMLGISYEQVLDIDQANRTGMPTPAQIKLRARGVWEKRLEQQDLESVLYQQSQEGAKARRELVLKILHLKNNEMGNGHGPASKIQRQFNTDKWMPKEGWTKKPENER